MDHANAARVLNLLGLFMGFVGTVFVWRNSAPAGPQMSAWDIPVDEVSRRGAISRRGLRVGLGMLAAGFALQFAAAIIAP